MEAPNRIVVAGDVGNNTRGFVHLISQVPQLLAWEEQWLILQLGDFGIWPGEWGARHVESIIAACAAHNVRVWFVDGNHEDFTRIGGYRITGDEGQRVAWLPRGHRWEWHGRRWLAFGGGVSLDAHGLVERRPGKLVQNRTAGKDWWPQEEISDADAARVFAGGRADVMVCHDCPSGVGHAFPGRPAWWSPYDLGRSERHQERLQRIVDVVRPSHFMHGHLARCYARISDFGWGPVDVTGLGDIGDRGSYAVLDVRSMSWDIVA